MSVLSSGVRAETVAVADLETAHLKGSGSQDMRLLGAESMGAGVRFGARDLKQQGALDLGDFARYAVNVDVPFDAGSGDGLVPYLSLGNSSINIRGVEGNRIQLTVDGIPQAPSFIANSFDQSAEGPGGTGRDFFDPAIYGEIVVMKGPSLTQDSGGALGGAVNLSTPDVSKILGAEQYLFEQSLGYFDVDQSIHSLTTGAVQSGPFSVLARYSYRDGEARANNGRTPENPTEYTSEAALVKGHYNVNTENVVTFTAESYRKKQASEVDSAEDPMNFYANERVYTEDLRERERISIGYESQALDSWFADSVELVGFYQSTRSQAYNIQQGGVPGFPVLLRDREQTNTHEINAYGGSLHFRKDFEAGPLAHRFRYGLNLQEQQLENAFIRVDYLPPTMGVTNLLGFPPSDSTRLGAYVADAVDFGAERQWTLNASLRWDQYEVEPDISDDYEQRRQDMEVTLGEPVPATSSYDDNALSASLGLSYQMNEDWRIRGVYTLANRMPTEEELGLVFTHGNNFVVMPNPDLQRETGQTFELGALGEFIWGFFDATVFYSKYTDYIDASYLVRPATFTTVGIQQPRNVGEVEIYGFEVGTEYDLSQLHSDLNGYHVGLNTGQSFGKNETTGEWIDTIDPWKTVAWLEYMDPVAQRYGIRLTGTYVDAKRRVGVSGAEPSKAYFLLDLTANLKIGEHVTVIAGVNNLLDREYYKWSTLRRAVGHANVVTDRLTEPGRNFFVNATISF